jgi:hypothetical protein
MKPMGEFFKTAKPSARCLYLHPLCFMLMGEMAHWAVEHQAPYVVTETYSTQTEDYYLKRVSATHREGRAFDISAHDWTDDKIKEFVDFFNTKYKDIAAISGETGLPTLVVYHNAGNGFHFHVQINQQYAVTPMDITAINKGE